MTDHDSLELARRLVACPKFRWIPGMLDSDGVRFCTLVAGRPHGALQSGHASMVRGLPDLRDPATLGCLLQLVRDAWVIDGSWRRIFVFPEDDGRFVVLMHTKVMGGIPVIRPLCVNEPRGSTEAEALVAALEAAPE